MARMVELKYIQNYSR